MDKISGPLGLWSWPLLNALLNLVQSKRLSNASMPSPQLINEETWTWIDWHGKERTITVHRKVEEK